MRRAVHRPGWAEVRDQGAYLVASLVNGARQFRRAGVTHVVTADPAQAATLDQVDGLSRVWWQDDVAIHEVLPAAGRPAPGDLLQPAFQEPVASGLAATSIEEESEHLAWTADAPAGLAVVAAANYDPAWHAPVDGDPVPVRRSTDGFVELDLPAGRHRVDLRFTATRPDPVGVVLTLAGLLALAYIFMKS